VLEEAWDVYGEMMPGLQPVPGALVGKLLSALLMDSLQVRFIL
jgi:hypothetical protein